MLQGEICQGKTWSTDGLRLDNAVASEVKEKMFAQEYRDV